MRVFFLFKNSKFDRIGQKGPKREMKKICFFLFHIFIAIGAHANVQFTITCDDTAGNGCKIDGAYDTYLIDKCSNISSITKDNPVIINTSETGSLCSDRIKAKRDQSCSTMGRYVQDYYVVFCEGTTILDTIGTKYDGITDANLSYAEKKCRGSGGNLAEGKCTCSNTQTKPTDGECLCTTGNTKYLVGNSCNEGSACISTGGDPSDNGTQCDCPPTMHSVKLRDTDIKVCECNKGYQYRDPMRRWEGCVKTNEKITISGTVQDHDNNETLPGTTILIIDGDLTTSMGGTSDKNGSFTIQNVPNTAYVKFSYLGYKSAVYAATELRNSIIKLKSDSYALNETTITPSDEQVTTTNNPTQDCNATGGTGLDKNGKCICDSTKFLKEYKYNDKYSICRCMDGYKRNNENNDATGECVYAPETKTDIVRDDMAMQRDAESAYRNEYDNAQSLANKGTTALSTLMTGEGAKMAAQAIAEKIADDDAEEKMSEYITTMECEYGGGKQVNLGKEETLPGGNELTNYYTEYKQLADKLKATKTALNLRPGIETEVLYDRAETGLYQYQTAERQSGGFTSLSRALMNPDGADAAAWNAQRAETNRNLLVGGALATTGLVGSYVANRAINKNHKKEYKELEEKFNKIETKLLNAYPEIFKPTEQEPVVEIVEETSDEETYTTTFGISTKDTTFKSDTFDSGYLILSTSGKEALKRLAESITTELENTENTKITKVTIAAFGFADPDPIRKGWEKNLTQQYLTELSRSSLPESYNGKIDTNEKLAQARAENIMNYLAKQFREDIAVTQNTATGVVDNNCKTTDTIAKKAECRHVNLNLIIETKTTKITKN